ncbi:MAG: cyclase family protein [Bacteroidia bacterium]|nr:cyclase family protein [Bacteroidia bacterium]MDW8157364.1 cyclase family protein [Bacteroidia bacterium]
MPSLRILHQGKILVPQLNNPISLAIPLNFDGQQPNHFDAPYAMSHAYQTNNFIGDVQKGGSCNVKTIIFTPHCNGTHTECVGHITYEKVSIHSVFHLPLCLALLISVEPQKAITTREPYTPPLAPEDEVITLEKIQGAIEKAAKEKVKALIVRTLPNSEEKKVRKYSQQLPTFFTRPAIEAISQLPILHLLVDFPSIDKMYDEGKLTAHHIFWGVEEGANSLNVQVKLHRTITEMIYVPENVPDGLYLLNLQVAPFLSDAAPANPIIFTLKYLK